MSTAFAFEPVRRPGPARPVEVAPVAAAPAAGIRSEASPRAVPHARPRVLAGAAVLAGVVCVVAAQLVLSIGIANGAYRLAELQQRSDVLSRQQQVQAEALQALAAPQHLAASAAALGMVPDDSPAYLDARTGRVLGSTAAAVAAASAATSGPASIPGGVAH